MMGECELCGKWANLDKHHIFMGNKQRNLSEKYGAVIYICRECHTAGRFSVHKCRFTNLALQEQAQRRIMKEQNWNIEDFIKVFGKNYL